MRRRSGGRPRADPRAPPSRAACWCRRCRGRAAHRRCPAGTRRGPGAAAAHPVARPHRPARCRLVEDGAQHGEDARRAADVTARRRDADVRLALAEGIEQQRTMGDRLVARQPDLAPDARRRPDGRRASSAARQWPGSGSASGHATDARGGDPLGLRGSVGRRLAPLRGAGRPDDGRVDLLPLVRGQHAALRRTRHAP